MSFRVLTPPGVGGAPGGAATSHPSPYALSHFTFIRTRNDFPPMEVGEETMTHLLGGGGGGRSLGPTTAIEATCRKTLPGKCFTFTEVTQKRCDNTFYVVFLYAQTALRRS